MRAFTSSSIFARSSGVTNEEEVRERAKFSMQSRFSRRFLTSSGTAVGLGVAFEVAEVAIDFAFDQSGAASLAGAANRLFRSVVDGAEVVSVNRHSRHVEPFCSFGHVGAGYRVFARRGLGVAVVPQQRKHRAVAISKPG